MGWDRPYGGLSETCHKEGPIRGGVRPPPTRPRPQTSSHLWACPGGGGAQACGSGGCRTMSADGGQDPGAARDATGAGEGLAQRGWLSGLPGLGKGLEQKCFLFQRLPAWPGSTTPS